MNYDCNYDSLTETGSAEIDWDEIVLINTI